MNPADAMPFSKLMGVSITAASADAVEGEITVREELCTAGGIMHGGAIMAFADALGAVGAVACLPEGAKGTTTIESKTNFLGAAPVGSTVRGRPSRSRPAGACRCGRPPSQPTTASRSPW